MCSCCRYSTGSLILTGRLKCYRVKAWSSSWSRVSHVRLPCEQKLTRACFRFRPLFVISHGNYVFALGLSLVWGRRGKGERFISLLLTRSLCRVRWGPAEAIPEAYQTDKAWYGRLRKTKGAIVSIHKRFTVCLYTLISKRMLWVR